MISLKTFNYKQTGFSLMEVMASLMIFSVVLAGMGPAFVAHTRHNTQSELRIEAIAAAEQVIDNLRFTDPTQLPTTGTTSQNISIGNRSYSTVTSYCLNTQYCASASNRHITVAVSYRNDPIFSTQTVFTQLR